MMKVGAVMGKCAELMGVMNQVHIHICMLQHAAVCCSVLQRVAACCSGLQRAHGRHESGPYAYLYIAACCSVLQRVAVGCSELMGIMHQVHMHL